MTESSVNDTALVEATKSRWIIARPERTFTLAGTLAACSLFSAWLAVSGSAAPTRVMLVGVAVLLGAVATIALLSDSVFVRPGEVRPGRGPGLFRVGHDWFRLEQAADLIVVDVQPNLVRLMLRCGEEQHVLLTSTSAIGFTRGSLHDAVVATRQRVLDAAGIPNAPDLP